MKWLDRPFWQIFLAGLVIGFFECFSAMSFAGGGMACQLVPPKTGWIDLPNLIGCKASKGHIACPDEKAGRPSYCMVAGTWVRIDR